MVRMDRKDWRTPWEQGFDAGVAGKTEADNPFPDVDGSPYEGPTENEQWSEGLVIGKLRKLRDDYAALEAERDELAARLRAVEDAWRERWNLGFSGTGLFIKKMETAINGPIPECEGCKEKDDLIGHAIAIISCYLDSGLAAPDVDEAARGWLARQAADKGGGHE